MNSDLFLPILLSSLAVLILGCWNNPMFQAKQNGRALGYPSYVWLALASLAVGAISVYLIFGQKNSKITL